jgi:hypothetical protein
VAFSARAESTERDLTARAARIDALASALTRFASRLDAVCADLTTARAAAAAAGCIVTPTAIDTATTDPARAGSIAASIAAARDDESQAHADLGTALDRSRGEGALENLMEDLGFAPPDGGDRLDLANWGYGLTSLGAGTAAQLHLERIGLSCHGAVRRVSQEARAAQSAAREASRMNLVAKVTGPVGNGLALGFAFKGQWETDADDRSLSGTDRFGRAVVRGGLEGGSAIAGGIVGGEIGTSIGTMICPGVGTVVGGVVGSAVGAFTVSQAGHATTDAAVEAVDDVIDAAEDVGEAVGDAAGAVADAGDAALDAADDAKDAAVDKAKEVGDKLCFWS